MVAIFAFEMISESITTYYEIILFVKSSRFILSVLELHSVDPAGAFTSYNCSVLIVSRMKTPRDLYEDTTVWT